MNNGVDRQLRLDSHCDSCPLPDCGGRHTRFACGDPALYPQSVLHPSRYELARFTNDLVLPPIPGRWAKLSADVATLPVLEDASWGGGRHALDISTFLARHARLSRPLGERGVILVGRDEEQKRVWRNQVAIKRNLADAFTFVVPPAFSQYDDHPPAHSRFELARTIHLAVELSEVTDVVFPLTWRFRSDLELQADWLSDDLPATLYVDLGLPEGDLWRQCLDDLRSFAKLLPGQLPLLLVQGASSIERIRAIASAWDGHLSIVSQKPWILSRLGQLIEGSGEERPSSLAKPDLLRLNIENFELLVSKLLGRR